MANFTPPQSASDTIVAESTPPGSGGIAIVRLSGPLATQVATKLQKEADLAAPPSHKLVRRQLVDGHQAVLDEAMVVQMFAPHSYTGEDVVELHLHGGPAVVDATLQACLAAGARLAAPGEFTRRAYLAGKLDLAQAEAVGALVSAQDDQQRRAALRLLAGESGTRLQPWLQTLEGVVAAWRAALDFPDEVDEQAALPAALAAVAALAAELEALLGGAQLLAAEGPQVVLLGDVNVGKSTLLNALAGRERALVDAAAGTTRDALALPHAYGHLRFTVWDTAGLRAEATGVEARGVALARAQAARADVRLWLTGASGQSWPEADLGPVFAVGSQRDQTSAAGRAAVEKEAQRRGVPFVGWICAPSGEGLAALQAFVVDRLRAAQTQAAAGHVLALRHRTLLQDAQRALVACAAAAAAGLPLDCLLAEVEDAAALLGQVLGKDVDAAVLDRIFADFCLGK